MKTEHTVSGTWLSSTIRRTIVAVLAVATTLAFGAATANADETSYPVRLCSPQVFDGNGYPYNTYTGYIGDGTQVYKKAPDGTVTYGAVTTGQTSWTLWNPALRCAAGNSSNAGRPNFGIAMFTPGVALFNKNEEGGLEFTAPAGMTIQQLSMSGKAVQPNDPNSQQGGIANGGARLKMDFIAPQGQTLTHVPTQTYDNLPFGASLAQNSTKVRLGLVCNPNAPATMCIGAVNEVVYLNNLVLTLGDPTPPTISLGSTPLADGQWVSGQQEITYTASDNQSGLRQTYVMIDNQLANVKIHECETITGEFSGGFTGTMARTYKPCPQGPQTETISINTAQYGDGLHSIRVCARDFARWSPYWNNDEPGAPSCTDPQIVRIDNSAPAAPEGASAIDTRIPRVVNPYDVSWNNPGVDDPGSPIHEVRYSIVNQTGNEVVSETTVNNGSLSGAPADTDQAENIEHIPTLQTPLNPGNFKLLMRLVDKVGKISKVTEVPLTYACSNSGGTPLTQASIGMGIVVPGETEEKATEFRALHQGDKAAIVGKVRGPGQMPVNEADVCINSKPVVDPQLEFMANATTNGDGNYRVALDPGPSRHMVTVFRQGHRETWSDRVSTEVTVEPTLSTSLRGGANKWQKKQKKATTRTGKVVWFKGSIPGPYNDKVVVVIQGKPAHSSDKAYRAFRRYRTRDGGKFKMRNVFYNTSKTGKKAYLKIRVQVRKQSGYPYSQGDSREMTLVVLPKKTKKIK